MSGSGFDYDSVSGDYQFRVMHTGPSLQRFWHRNKLQVIEHVLDVAPDHCVVEVGCGAGNLILHAASCASRAIGVDISLAALRFCQHRASDAGLGSVLFLLASGSALPLLNDYADRIIFVEVIEHLERPQQFLSELYRILKPGGQVFITTPNCRSLWPILEWALDRLNLTPKMVDEQHVSRFVPSSLAAAVQSAGFQVAQLGTFYTYSPLLQFLFSSLANRLVIRELNSASQWGMLIYCLATKPENKY